MHTDKYINIRRLSEAWVHYAPLSKDINISIVWLAAGIAFSLQVIYKKNFVKS